MYAVLPHIAFMGGTIIVGKWTAVEVLPHTLERVCDNNWVSVLYWKVNWESSGDPAHPAKFDVVWF